MPADPAVLATIPLFASLSELERAEVASWLEVKDVRAGVRLVGEGTTGYSLFVLTEGAASVTAGGEQVGTLAPGDFFGEMALLHGGRRLATVTTTAPTRVLVLFGDDFGRLQAGYPGIVQAIEESMEKRLEQL